MAKDQNKKNPSRKFKDSQAAELYRDLSKFIKDVQQRSPALHASVRSEATLLLRQASANLLKLLEHTQKAQETLSQHQSAFNAAAKSYGLHSLDYALLSEDNNDMILIGRELKSGTAEFERLSARSHETMTFKTKELKKNKATPAC